LVLQSLKLLQNFITFDILIKPAIARHFVVITTTSDTVTTSVVTTTVEASTQSTTTTTAEATTTSVQPTTTLITSTPSKRKTPKNQIYVCCRYMPVYC